MPPAPGQHRPDPARPVGPATAADRDEDVAASGFVLPGGKVDPDALRAAIDQAREQGDDDQALRTLTFTLRRDLQKRLDKYLTDRVTFLSRTQLQGLIDAGEVTVNGRVAKASTKVGTGDVVRLVIPEPPATNIIPEDIPLAVLYEDDHLIVINKAPDIIVHPARTHLRGTMLSALAYHFAHRSRVGGSLSAVGKDLARPGVVHRLDRDTSGCIVFAKTDEAHWKLGHQFEHRRVDKRYIALVHGRVEPDVQPIDLPIGPHPSREKGYREKQVVRHDELGKDALTICRVRARWRREPVQHAHNAPRAINNAPALPADLRDFSLVELELKTGRTHQIRVHLSYNLWPIVGDDMYGGKGLALDPQGRLVPFIADGSSPPAGLTAIVGRQWLHAALLAFAHPITGEPLSFSAPLPADLSAGLRALGGLAACDDASPMTPPGSTLDLAALAVP